MKKQEFINRVMLIMNEAGMYDAAGAAFIGADSAQIDKHIEGSYVDAWRRIAKVAPRTWLGNKSFKSSTGIIDTFSISDNSQTPGGGVVTGDIMYISSQTGEKAWFTATVTQGIISLTIISSGSGFQVSSYGLSIYTGVGESQDMSLNVLTIKSILNNPISDLPNGTGYILLPKDFYLLSKFKMTGWKIAAMEASIANSRTANIQNNEYTRGSEIRPAVVIDNKEVDGVIKPVLEYYSLQKGLSAHTVEEALYVPVVEELSGKPTTYDLGINDQIIIPLAYLSAATVFTIFEKYPVAQALEARAEAMMPGLISLKGANATVKQ